MSQTLSQDEVNALLRGMADGQVEVPEPDNSRGVARPYDLVGEERLAGREFPALNRVHERFVRKLRRSLSSFVGALCTVDITGVEALKFNIFRNRLPVGATHHIFSMAPLRGQALLAVSGPLAFAVVDRVFGGVGRAPAHFEAFDASPIASQMLQRLVVRALADLTEAWSSVHRLECRFVRTETNPTEVAITGPGEMVLSLTLECNFGDEPAPLIIAVPYAVLEPLRVKLGEPESVPAGGDRDWVAAIAQAVRQTAVTVTTELGTQEISGREVLRLKPGDVISLGTRGDDPVTIRVEGIRLLSGLAGVSRGQNAVRILGRDTGQ
jgi:flagellar motor switch protein FliM